MTNSIITVDTTNFEKDILQVGDALVDFWAPWCGPCKMIAPIIEAVASDYTGSLVFAKLNVDDSPAIAQQYGVRGIPTLLLFKEGKVRATKVGVMTQIELIDFLKENV